VNSVKISWKGSGENLRLDLISSTVGPLNLTTELVDFTRAGEEKQLEIEPNSPEIKILNFGSVNGRFSVKRSVRSANSTEVTICSEIQTGRTLDYLRVKFSEGGEEKFIDLPIQIRVASAIQFVPGKLNLSQIDGKLFGRVRILTSKSIGDLFERLAKVRVRGKDGELVSAAEYKVVITAIQPRLFWLAIEFNSKTVSPIAIGSFEIEVDGLVFECAVVGG